MTENEAKEIIRNFPNWNLDDQWLDEDEMQGLADMLILVLEEIQQYRAIGIVKEIKEMIAELSKWHSDRLNDKIKNPFACMSTLICHNCDHKDEYIEELEAEIEEYKAIGTVEELWEAMEKQKQGLKLVEPNEEEYAVCVNEYNFSIFDLFYTNLGYTTLDGKPLSEFKNHYGYFIACKKEKVISFMETLIFSVYEDKHYGLMELIKED